MDSRITPSLSKEMILKVLSLGKLVVEGQFTFGSNYTFLVSANLKETSLKAVYKPQKGEIPLWDFPPETLAHRETAAYLLSEAIHWNFVPPTVIRQDGPFGQGSMQLFITHDPEINYFTFPEHMHQKLKRVAVFDMVINNADRKGSHIIIDEKEKLWLIDHGISFHQDPKLRTVIWDFIGEQITSNILHDLEDLLENIKKVGPFYREFRTLLSGAELAALNHRIRLILQSPVFPQPGKNSNPIPFPLV